VLLLTASCQTCPGDVVVADECSGQVHIQHIVCVVTAVCSDACSGARQD